jgi:hypothetical protein
MLQAYIVSLIPTLRFRMAACFTKAGAGSIGSFGDNLVAARPWVFLMQSDADAVC